MEVSPYILEEAKQLLARRSGTSAEMPIQLTSAPDIYVAEANDDTIMAFGAVRDEHGKSFKIGARRQ
ncbi:MAG: hypothetical protein SGJ19_08115 [Planctomycetia bacterium]|nr:hypothetical protein [Planctomycetia bacterium]